MNTLKHSPQPNTRYTALLLAVAFAISPIHAQARDSAGWVPRENVWIEPATPPIQPENSSFQPPKSDVQPPEIPDEPELVTEDTQVQNPESESPIESESVSEASPPSSIPDPLATPSLAESTTAITAIQEQARSIANEGRIYYEQENYEQAILSWEQAWQLSREPILMYNLGRAYWKRYETEANLDFLYKARGSFANYKLLASKQSSYDPQEIDRYLAAIDAQINAAKQTSSNYSTLSSTTRTLSAEDIRLARRQQVTTALRASGTTAIVLGSLSVGLIIAGFAMRGVTGFVLDSSGGAEEGRPNFNTAESDARQRQIYQRGGQLALAGIITTSILLPVGIGLRVAGDIRKRQDERSEKVKLSLQPTSIHIKF